MLWMQNNKFSDSYKKQSKTAFLGFLSELPNFIASIGACIITRSTLVLADLISSGQTILHYLIVFIISHKYKDEVSEKYNFGIEKIDGFASLICDFMMIIGFLVIIFYGIHGFLFPSAISDNLYLFLILKTINISIDIYFVANQIAILKKERTKISESELTATISYLADDSVTMLFAVAAYMLRHFSISYYFTPVYCLGSGFYFIIRCIRHMKKSMDDLTEKAVPIEKQEQLVDIILSHRSICKRINGVNSKTMNDTTIVELDLLFQDNTTYQEQVAYLEEVSAEINAVIPNTTVYLVIKKPI